MKCEIEGYEDIEFVVGQKWRTRRGEVFEISEVFYDHNLSYPIYTVNGTSHTRNGLENKYREDVYDLVELVDVLVEEEVTEPVEEEVTEVIETYEDNINLWKYPDNDRIKAVEDIELYPIETSVEDKMVEILHQLLSQRDRDLEKLSLVFNTFIKMEEMK